MNGKNLAIGFHILKKCVPLYVKVLENKNVWQVLNNLVVVISFRHFFPFTLLYFLLFNINFDLAHILVMCSGV
jgi:hypothetical protein